MNKIPERRAGSIDGGKTPVDAICEFRMRRPGTVSPQRVPAGIGAWLFAFLLCLPAWAQVGPAGPVASSIQPEVPQDPLGRTTPRGTVLGFLLAERKGQDDLAVQFLNTRLSGKSAVALARQLYTVLDRRLPAELPNLSDKPEGARSNPLMPNEDRVGTISGNATDVDIVVERVDRGTSGSLWLFSRKTLDSIPNLYAETNLASVDDLLPEFLVNTRIANVPLYQWLAVFVGMPLFYIAVTLSGHLLGMVLGALRRRLLGNPDLSNPGILPIPIRLLLLALGIHWIFSDVSLPLFARQFWSSTATVITIAATAWLLILLTGWIEQYAHRLIRERNITGVAAILRLVRRVTELLVIVAGVLVTLYRFGLNPTAFLTGLGVGGIAVALAAQKTLENVIGGISLILDRVVHLNDTITLGNIRGTVENIGLRSTRIRTLDRTVVSIPNGQMANMTLENFSTRDKFWFHPVLALRVGTSAAKIRTVVECIGRLLKESQEVAADSVRVHFLQFARESLEVEVFAYVSVRDWPQFLAIQEGLLLRIAECLESVGVQIALPLQAAFAGAVNDAAGQASVDARAGQRPG